MSRPKRVQQHVLSFFLGAFIVLAFLHSTQGHSQSLGEYLEQVKSQNKAYTGNTLQSEASELQSRDADLVFTPQLFADGIIGDDKKPTTPQYYDSLKTQKYSLGLSQEFSFGLQTKIYYEVAETDFQGASPLLGNNTQYWDASPRVELVLPIWGGGFGRSAVAKQELSKKQNLAQKYESEARSLNILIGAEATYWKLSAWQDVVSIQEQAMQAAQNILNYVTKKKRMNLGEQSDVVQAKALAEARTLELQMAKNEALAAQRSFNRFLNRDAESPVGKLDPVDYKALENLTVPEARPGYRPDVQAVEAQLDAAKAAGVLAGEKNRPTLDLFGNYALNGRDERFRHSVDEAGRTDQDSAYVGLRFKMPLNFSAAGDVRSGALKAQRAAELNREYALYAQEQDWVDLVRTLSEARENLKLISKIEIAQKAKLDVERVRHKQGRTTTYQVLLFEQDYSAAALSKAKSAAQILGLQSQIKIYQGRN